MLKTTQSEYWHVLLTNPTICQKFLRLKNFVQPQWVKILELVRWGLRSVIQNKTQYISVKNGDISDQQPSKIQLFKRQHIRYICKKREQHGQANSYDLKVKLWLSHHSILPHVWCHRPWGCFTIGKEALNPISFILSWCQGGQFKQIFIKVWYPGITVWNWTVKRKIRTSSFHETSPSLANVCRTCA